MQSFDLTESTKVTNTVKLLLTCLGAWPKCKPIHQVLFVMATSYMTIHTTLAVVFAAKNIKDISSVAACSNESAFLAMAVVKIVIFKIRRKSLGNFLEEIDSDLVEENYETTEEKVAFLKYKSTTKKFVKYILMMAFIASPCYFVMKMATCIVLLMSNSTVGYPLPYKVHVVIEPTGLISYIFLCLYQVLFVPYVILGYCGTDCLFFIFVFHVAGLLSALSCKIKHVLADPTNRFYRMKQIIKIHVRLIRLAQILEDNFNFMILIEIIGLTLNFCFVGYDALVNSNDAIGMVLLTFLSLTSAITGILLAYGYIGECLIKESLNLGETFYQCEWYNITSEEKKLLQICMIRTTRHLRLTSGKFCILSLSTFTDVLKTAMAYFSMLRSFL